jgi:serpin B
MFGFFKKKPAAERKADDPPPLSPMPPKAASGDQKFSVALFHELAKAAPGNLFFSPYSVSTALAMVQAGASGRTREEIETALGYPGAGDALIEQAGKRALELAGRSAPTASEKNRLSRAEGVTPDSFGCHLSCANAIWHQTGYPVEAAFVEALRRRLGAEVRDVDFAKAPAEAVKIVNDWAAKATRDKIKDVLSPGLLHPMTRVLLANAIYFKARWEEEFHESGTQPKLFHLLNGSTDQVPMMHHGGCFPSVRDNEIHALQMNYSGGQVAMIILLPEPGKFEKVSKELDAGRLEGLMAAMSPSQTQLSMPKFRVESSFMLAAPLRALWIIRAFEKGDFSRISAEPGFFLSEVLHKTFVDVDEKGTEAAAVTIPMLAGSAPPRDLVQFHVDRPFLFLIRDLPTGTPLFLGRVVDPRPSSVR